MAKMSTMEERLRQIGRKWTGATDVARIQEPQAQAYISNLNVDEHLDRVTNTPDSRLSSASSLADAATGMALDSFPIPPARTAGSASRLPAHLPMTYAFSRDAADNNRRPSASSTITVVSDQEPCVSESRDDVVRIYCERDTKGLSSPLLRPASRDTICLGSPTLPSNDHSIGSASPSASTHSEEHSRASAGSGMNARQILSTLKIADEPSDMALQHHQDQLRSVPEAESRTQTVAQESTEWLVPPAEDLANWGELEIIGRR